MTLTLNNLINGDFVPAQDEEEEAVLNPATAEVMAHAPLSSADDVDRAVLAARAAFDSWSTTTPRERALCLIRLADRLGGMAETFADLESANAGKPRALFLQDELEAGADNLRFFAGAARCMNGLASGEFVEGHTSIIRREPVGVIGQITPWNYPLLMAIWKIGPALATGNTVVLKPAETTPVTTLGPLAELCAELFPPGVVNFVGGHGEPTGSALVTHPAIDMVSLTGSPATGRWIAEQAGRSLKRVHLELGGKAPVIVFDDVDLEATAQGIAGAGFYNAGQDCTAATRVIATKARA